MGQAQVHPTTIRPLASLMKEVLDAVERSRGQGISPADTIKDLRWKFDQVSSKMNQAIYNDQAEQIHRTCLETVAVLIEMLARS